MTKTQKTVAKGILLGMWVREHNHLTKAYLCLMAASIYGICAAREANDRADETLEKLDVEYQRPVILVEP